MGSTNGNKPPKTSEPGEKKEVGSKDQNQSQENENQKSPQNKD